MTAPIKIDMCARCYRAGPDLGNCGDFAIGCPQPRPTNPLTDVVIRCDQCDITRAVPVERIMQGKIKAITGRCTVDRCKAIIIRPAAPNSKGTEDRGKGQQE